jgi:hypothetical protein
MPVCSLFRYFFHFSERILFRAGSINCKLYDYTARLIMTFYHHSIHLFEIPKKEKTRQKHPTFSYTLIENPILMQLEKSGYPIHIFLIPTKVINEQYKELRRRAHARSFSQKKAFLLFSSSLSTRFGKRRDALDATHGARALS